MPGNESLDSASKPTTSEPVKTTAEPISTKAEEKPSKDAA
jgi:hypothetical protein